MDKIKHNNLEFEAIPLNLEPAALITIYGLAVCNPYCKHSMIVFGVDRLLVGNEDDVIDFMITVLEQAQIIPSLKLNPDWYKRVRQFEKDCPLTDEEFYKLKPT